MAEAEARFIPETLFDDLGFRMTFRADRVLTEERSAHQDLALFESPRFGRMLMLDGATQVTSADEFIYSEMMSHLPLLAHGRARRALIVGGGDCLIAEEMLKHAGLESVTQVEIDAAVVEFSKAWFADLNASVFADPRFRSVIADGMAFVADPANHGRFDVIAVDSTDPQGPGAVLFSEGFYRTAKACLAPGGVMVTQNGVPFLQPDELRATLSIWRDLFADAGAYVAAIPTYVGGHMTMGFASDDPAARATPLEKLEARFAAAAPDTRYYTPEVHRAAFALPRFIRDIARQALGQGA